jgi:hypothetical protein
MTAPAPTAEDDVLSNAPHLLPRLTSAGRCRPHLACSVSRRHKETRVFSGSLRAAWSIPGACRRDESREPSSSYRWHIESQRGHVPAGCPPTVDAKRQRCRRPVDGVALVDPAARMRARGDDRTDANVSTELRSAAALGLMVLTGCSFSSPEVSACGPTNSPNWITCMLELAPYAA